MEFLRRFWFQHTAARRRLGMKIHLIKIKIKVSTHSRPKAAGHQQRESQNPLRKVSTHSRPKAAGVRTVRLIWCIGSFNTQPPEGGWATDNQADIMRLGFNTQPPEGGWGVYGALSAVSGLFQHTAARRRLANEIFIFQQAYTFQHTAARRRLVFSSRSLRLRL